METNLKKQLAIVIFLYLGDICVGYLAWSSPVIVKLQDPDQTPLPDVITDQEGSWLGASLLPGTLIGAFLSAWFMNTFGRKPSILLGGIIIMACFLLLATADQLSMVIVGRALNGLGGGIVYLSNLTYIAEISSTNIRGMLLTGTGFFTCLGILLVFSIGPYFTYVGIMYVGFFLAMIFSIGVLFVSESPAFHVLKGKEIEAKTTLVALGRADDIEEILSSKPCRAKSLTQGIKDMIYIRTNRKAFFISVVLFISQGLSGYVTMTLCVTPVFQSVNSSIDPGLATIIVGFTQLVSSCVTPLFVERKGRKIMLITSTAGCSLSMTVLATYFALQNAGHASATQLHWLPLVAVIVFLISYQSGYFTIPGACASEMFDSSARGPGSSLAFSAGTVTCFIVTASFSYLVSTIGSHMTFLIHAAANAFACVFTCVFVVETKGKSLAEVQLLLSKQ